MSSHPMWLVILIAAAVDGALYDTFTGELVTPARAQEWARLNLTAWCTIKVADCEPHERRRLDHSCNNPRHPPRGATLTPYGRLLPPVYGRNYSIRPAKNGEDLPNVRDVRVAIISDGRRSSAHYTQLITHTGVFLTGDVTSLHDTVNYVVLTRDCCKPGAEQDPRCLPIRVAADDVHLRRSNIRCLNLTAPITYQRLLCAPQSLPPARINTTPPLLELSIIYGNTARAAQRAREMAGGRLRTEWVGGREWPPSGGLLCLLNVPQAGETRCHDSANPGINSILGLNLYGLWFTRNHNQLARALESLNSCWNDEQLFMTARDINIAVWQQLVYYEYMPSILGYDYMLERGAIYNTYGHVEDYDQDLEPQLSLEYVMTTRWFHTMQEGRLRFYNRRGEIVDEKAIVDFTLRTGALPINNTLEGVTLGSFRQPAAAADNVVDPDVGERILGRLQVASDVMASDIMKGRAAGLPSYNDYRKYCGLPYAKTFSDLLHWMTEEQFTALRTSYRDVGDIDLMAGMVSEGGMRGAAVGATLGCIMTEQLRRWRRSDRYWYENSQHPGAFSAEQLLEIRKTLLSRLICDHGEGVDHIQPYAFLLPGPGNDMRKCSEIPKMDVAPWKDCACAKSDARAAPDDISANISFKLWDNLDRA